MVALGVLRHKRSDFEHDFVKVGFRLEDQMLQAAVWGIPWVLLVCSRCGAILTAQKTCVQHLFAPKDSVITSTHVYRVYIESTLFRREQMQETQQWPNRRIFSQLHRFLSQFFFPEVLLNLDRPLWQANYRDVMLRCPHLELADQV